MRFTLLVALLGASAAAAFPTDDAPCEAKCIVAGHCCQGSTSACQKPSCAQGKPMDERCAVRRQTRRQYAQPTLFGHLQRRRLNDSHGRHIRVSRLTTCPVIQHGVCSPLLSPGSSHCQADECSVDPHPTIFAGLLLLLLLLLLAELKSLKPLRHSCTLIPQGSVHDLQLLVY